MLEKLMNLLSFAPRQKFGVYRFGDLLSSLFSGGISVKKITAVIIAFFEMFGSALFDTAFTPLGEPLDLTGYELVFCDEFDGDSLNTDVWEFRRLGKDAGGYSSTSQVRVEGGNLIFTSEYRENGEYGPGWYAADIQIKEKYKQGYFEIKCICNDFGDFWSAFWIQADHPYDHDISNGGIGGAELDIFEAMDANDKLMRNSVAQTVHCNGVDDDAENIDSCCVGSFKANDIFNTYNTYGLKWTEDEYIFYINGVETGRSTWGKGVSQVGEHVCVSLCIPGEVKLPHDVSSQFTVDYVKIWQKPETQS